MKNSKMLVLLRYAWPGRSGNFAINAVRAVARALRSADADNLTNLERQEMVMPEMKKKSTDREARADDDHAKIATDYRQRYHVVEKQ